MTLSNSGSIEFEFLKPLNASAALGLGMLDEYSEANKFIQTFRWAESVLAVYFGDHFEEKITILLFHIEPKLLGVDEYVWVILGDSPTAYITTENSPNPKCALDSYIGALEIWVSAVLSGDKVDELIPTGLNPTVENALKLSNKLKCLDREVLPKCKGALR